MLQQFCIADLPQQVKTYYGINLWGQKKGLTIASVPEMFVSQPRKANRLWS